ncbi:MAG TPA: transposase [candidate division Zixibacteria bacterium]
MKHNLEKSRHNSIRLKDYDYSQNGAYFVTVCARNHESFFGNVFREEIVLNKYGKIVNQLWNELPNHFFNIESGWFMVMPNHIHGVIVINNECRGGVTPPMGESAFGGSPLQIPKLGQIIAYFKYQTTKIINKIRSTPGLQLWQRNYYKHVVRNEDELNKIRYYIQTNPLKWHLDRENPERIGADELEDEIFNSSMTNQMVK